jgi:hypothetical protein
MSFDAQRFCFIVKGQGPFLYFFFFVVLCFTYGVYDVFRSTKLLFYCESAYCPTVLFVSWWFSGLMSNVHFYCFLNTWCLSKYHVFFYIILRVYVVWSFVISIVSVFTRDIYFNCFLNNRVIKTTMDLFLVRGHVLH